MARGVSFLTLVTRLREETGKSTNVGVGVDDTGALKRAINREYKRLARKHDWPFLRLHTAQVSLSAGQRFYDIPATIDSDSIDEISCKWGETYHPMHRGIDAREYSAYDSVADERSDPTLRWDLRYTGSTTQIEVWPVPAGDSLKLDIRGRAVVTDLVDDDDLCLLDDELVVLFAAARILKRQDSKDADLALSEANDYLNDLKAASNTAARRVAMGLGGADDEARTTVVLRVS